MDAFEVATEFRFDVGEALLNTKALKGAVDDLSNSATSAMGALNYLASGLVAHLGFGSGGLLSVLGKAVEISEAFNQSSLNFANNISSNMQTLTGTITTFNDRLGTSQMLMGNIAREAIKFGIDTSQLASIAQVLATPLANRGKLGTNYSGAINMGRNLSLASEAVGLNPGMSGEMLSRAITDHMAIHGALFARLVNTPAFKQGRIGTQSQLMVMNTDRKIDLLNKALEQLAGDSEWIAARLHTLGAQFTILKDQIALVLKPIGDAVIKPLVKMMAQVNTYLGAHGEMIGKNIGKLITSVIADPEGLFVNLVQLKHLKDDFKRALDWSSVIVIGTWIVAGLEKIGIVLGGGLLKKALFLLWDGIVLVLPMLWSFLMFAARYIGLAISGFIDVFAPLLFFFQIISRARGIAVLADLKNLTSLMPRLSAVMVRLKTAFENIFYPITMVIDFWARLIAPLFETSTYARVAVFVLEGLADVFEFLGRVSMAATAVFSALTYSIIRFIEDLAHLKNPFTNAGTNFNHAFGDFIDQNRERLGKAADHAANYKVENNNHIEARFDMREQMEPDRIAFAVTQHLKNLAINPTQARGGSVHAAFGNPKFAAAQ